MRKFILLMVLFPWISNSWCQFGPKSMVDPNPIAAPTSSEYPDLHILDWNSDGFNDIIMSIPGENQIVWYENLGNETFGPKTNIVTIAESPIFEFTIVDLDNDTDLDFVVVAEYPTGGVLYWYEDNGSGYTENYILGSPCIFNTGARVGDMDNDNDLDIMMIRDCPGELHFIEQTGPGTFTPSLVDNSVYLNGQTMDLADFDNDGLLDVVAHEKLTNEIFVYENLGAGSFSAPNLVATMAQVDELFAYDFNYDGQIDIIPNIGLAWGDFGWIENNGTFTGWTINTFQNGNVNKGEVLISDLNNDMKHDYICGEEWNIIYKLEYHLGDSMNNFTTDTLTGEINKGVTYDYFEFAVGDLTNDGAKEIVAYNRHYNELFWFKNFLYSPYKAYGNLFYDENQNGIWDGADFGFSFNSVYSGSNLAYSNYDGSYFLALDSGTHVIKPTPLNDWIITSNPDSVIVTLNDSVPATYGANFGFYPQTAITDLATNTSASLFVCDNDAVVWIDVQNTGTTMPETLIEIELHDSLSFISSSIPYDSLVGQSIYFSYDSLLFFETKSFNITVQCPDFNTMGDTLHIKSSAFEVVGTVLNLMDQDTSNQILFCSYDPNDKGVWPAGVGPEGFIPEDQELTYTIRFQNTGNFPATNILIRDTIHTNLDLSTFQLEGVSHPVQVNILPNNVVDFYFANIMLPDSTSNEPESHGYVEFKISPIAGLNPLDEIENTGYIFFDTNPAIITNTTLNTIECDTMTIPINYTIPYFYTSQQSGTFEWFIDGSPVAGSNNDSLYFQGPGSYVVSYTNLDGCTYISDPYDMNCLITNPIISYNFPYLISDISNAASYTWYLDGSIISITSQDTFSISSNGDYFVEVTDANGCIFTSNTVTISDVGLEYNESRIVVYPNPSGDQMIVNLSSEIAEGHLKVSSISGALLYEESFIADSKIILNKSDFGSGVFILEIMDASNEVLIGRKRIVFY